MLALMVIGSTPGARAQGNLLREAISSFVGINGYWFTSSSAVQALGTPKFGGDSHFYVRPAHRNGLLITGGLEIAGASDHWLPFTTGNSFSLTGPSFEVSGERGRVGRVVPFVSAGYFVGEVHSEQQFFDTVAVVPSMAVGAELKVHRYVTLTASYRVSGQIGGVDTDGFSLSLKLF